MFKVVYNIEIEKMVKIVKNISIMKEKICIIIIGLKFEYKILFIKKFNIIKNVY